MSFKLSLSKAVSLALVMALTSATPLPKAPTRILPRELPKPSPYPGKDGACEHEWQYLNFNVDDTTDQQRLDKLHHTVCSGEMRALSSYGAAAATDLLAPYKRFFPENDDEDDYDDVQDHVVRVLKLITGTSSTDGKIGSIVGDFIIDNLDFGDKYPAGSNKERCSTEGTLAYTAKDGGSDGIEADGLEKIHFCPIAYDRPQFEAIVADCAALDAYPSEKMDTFSRIALHEMTHMSTVGPPIIGDDDSDDDSDDDDDDSDEPHELPGQIKDVSLLDPEDGEKFPANGPINTHALVDKAQDDYFNPFVTEINADSYAWMSLDALVSRHCASDPSGSNWANFFTENPPAIDA